MISHHSNAIRRSAVRLAVIGLTALTSACSGGGSGSIPSAAAPVAPSSDTSTLATISLSIPDPTTALSTLRRAEDLSPATSAVSVSINNGTPTIVPLVNYSGCTALTGGRTCLVPVPVPAGTSSVKVWTYGTPDASGTPLSVGTITVNALSKTTTVVQPTMHPIVTALEVTIMPGTPFALGQPSSQTVQIIPLDASRYDIKPVNFSLIVDKNGSPVTITLVDNDSNAATMIAPAILTAAPEKLTYNGQPVGASATVFAYARNAANALVTWSAQTIPYTATAPSATPTPGPVATPTPTPAAPPTPGPTPSAAPKPSSTPTPAPGTITANSSGLTFNAAGSVQTFTLTQANYSGAFTTATIGGDPSAVTASVSGSTVSVRSEHAGSTSIVITGGAGSSVTVPATVSTTAITIQ